MAWEIWASRAWHDNLLATTTHPPLRLRGHPRRMDIVFKCEHCQQELSVDESGAGVQIECPACSQAIVVPAAPEAIINPISMSAAAREERHFKVPTYDKAAPPVAAKIEKPLTPLEVAARESDKKLRVKTLRHSDHVEVGKDVFDDSVTKFLQQVGEVNVVSISPIVYTHMELASRQWITDYGVLVVYKG